MKAHGFPSSEKRNSGSKVSRLPAIMVISAAGLLSEKVGKSEMPLFVTPADHQNTLPIACYRLIAR